MGKFNLIEEPWISVMIDEKGNTEEVSLTEIFQNASQYIDLAGDSPTQDFAVLRVLLAILHTVFSRFDAEGEAYPYFEINDQLKQVSSLKEDAEEDYVNKLYETWATLWQKKEFPPIVNRYLNQWYEHFYLFDEEFPFFQVTKEVIAPENISKAKPSSISGKTINRLISESGNKTALFSPKTALNKEILTAAEIARWLITYQGYCGLSDKVIFGEEKYKASKGWLFDIGGVFFKGENLLDTLLLNLVLVHPHDNYLNDMQKPSWEYSGEEIIERSFSGVEADNLAELYTSWSRAIYIQPETDTSKPFSFDVVKLPDIDHRNHFLEPMTIWRYNKQGENKDTYTPRKHQAEESMWRSFGLITLPNHYESEQKRPGIMDWLDQLTECEYIDNYDLKIEAVSMKDDGNATSWMPADEIHDSLRMNDLVLTDDEQEGWLIRINEVIEQTKDVINRTYYMFLSDIRKIRQLSPKHQFVSRGIADLFYAIDQPFRDWLSSIKPTDSKRDKIAEWYDTLDKIVNEQAKKMLENAVYRDYKGIKSEKQENDTENIITAYNRFRYFLNKQ